MKPFIYAVVTTSMLVAPAVAFAQSDSPVTRAQVRSELMQLEAAGYKPASGDEPNYPTNIQAAEARVSAHGQTDYGGALAGSSASGSRAAVSPASATDLNKIYFGGQ
jgi:hypothetical protein